MEYVPEKIRHRFENDRVNHFTSWLSTCADIQEEHCNQSYFHGSIADLIYALEYPNEEDSENFRASTYDENGYRPILLRGVVIENKLLESGDRLIQLVSGEDAENCDTKKLLHLRQCAAAYYSILGWHLYSEREYTIGDLQQLRPGTKVIVAATYLCVAENNPRWVKLRYADIAPDLESKYTFVDKHYKIHQSEKEFITLYNARVEPEKSNRDPHTVQSDSKETVSKSDNNGCLWPALKWIFILFLIMKLLSKCGM